MGLASLTTSWPWTMCVRERCWFGSVCFAELRKLGFPLPGTARGHVEKRALTAAWVRGNPEAWPERSCVRGEWMAGTWEQTEGRAWGEGPGTEVARRSTCRPTVMPAALEEAFSRKLRINSTAVDLMIRLARRRRLAGPLREPGISSTRRERALEMKVSSRASQSGILKRVPAAMVPRVKSRRIGSGQTDPCRGRIQAGGGGAGG